MKKKKGILFIISAPSGSGKTTLCTRLVELVDSLYRSISMTTRPPRPGEKDGTDYIFIEKPEFMKRLARKEFLEWAKVFGEYYATPKKHILHMLKRGSDVLLSIDVQGAMKIKRLKLDAVYIFILPPSLDMLRERLVNRSTDSREAIKKRLEIARQEIARSDKYDYIVVNNRLESALDSLRAIIVAERCRVKRDR
ncbi:MAG: guanylate kinase [Candidatus Omnitrophota bacterium]|nr:guanylate kinase [Candidatus Omnitrophota bacterium]